MTHVNKMVSWTLSATQVIQAPTVCGIVWFEYRDIGDNETREWITVLLEVELMTREVCRKLKMTFKWAPEIAQLLGDSLWIPRETADYVAEDCSWYPCLNFVFCFFSFIYFDYIHILPTSLEPGWYQSNYLDYLIIWSVFEMAMYCAICFRCFNCSSSRVERFGWTVGGFYRKSYCTFMNTIYNQVLNFNIYILLWFGSGFVNRERFSWCSSSSGPEGEVTYGRSSLQASQQGKRGQAESCG